MVCDVHYPGFLFLFFNPFLFLNSARQVTSSALELGTHSQLSQRRSYTRTWWKKVSLESAGRLDSVLLILTVLFLSRCLTHLYHCH